MLLSYDCKVGLQLGSQVLIIRYMRVSIPNGEYMSGQTCTLQCFIPMAKSQERFGRKAAIQYPLIYR